MHRRNSSLKGSIISCQPSEPSQHCAVKESEQRKKAVYDRRPICNAFGACVRARCSCRLTLGCSAPEDRTCRCCAPQGPGTSLMSALEPGVPSLPQLTQSCESACLLTLTYSCSGDSALCIPLYSLCIGTEKFKVTLSSPIV